MCMRVCLVKSIYIDWIVLQVDQSSNSLSPWLVTTHGHCCQGHFAASFRVFFCPPSVWVAAMISFGVVMVFEMQTFCSYITESSSEPHGSFDSTFRNKNLQSNTSNTDDFLQEHFPRTNFIKLHFSGKSLGTITGFSIFICMKIFLLKLFSIWTLKEKALVSFHSYQTSLDIASNIMPLA